MIEDGSLILTQSGERMDPIGVVWWYKTYDFVIQIVGSNLEVHFL